MCVFEGFVEIFSVLFTQFSYMDRITCAICEVSNTKSGLIFTRYASLICIEYKFVELSFIRSLLNLAQVEVLVYVQLSSTLVKFIPANVSDDYSFTVVSNLPRL